MNGANGQNLSSWSHHDKCDRNKRALRFNIGDRVNHGGDRKATIVHIWDERKLNPNKRGKEGRLQPPERGPLGQAAQAAIDVEYDEGWFNQVNPCDLIKINEPARLPKKRGFLWGGKSRRNNKQKKSSKRRTRRK